MLRIVDRAAAENDDEAMAPIYEKLQSVDCIPQKRDGFINYTINLTKADRKLVERAWNRLDSLHKKQRQEKQEHTATIVGKTVVFVNGRRR